MAPYAGLIQTAMTAKNRRTASECLGLPEVEKEAGDSKILCKHVSKHLNAEEMNDDPQIGRPIERIIREKEGL